MNLISPFVVFSALMLAIVSVMSAATVFLMLHSNANNQRAALIQFVCTSVQIREETNDPSAAIFRARFDAILGGLGENTCPKVLNK